MTMDELDQAADDLRREHAERQGIDPAKPSTCSRARSRCAGAARRGRRRPGTSSSRDVDQPVRIAIPADGRALYRSRTSSSSATSPHSGAIAAACLLVFGERRRPGAVRRASAFTLVFAALAAVGSLITGGNYMFMRRKPASGSLLDLMGPWPVYIAVAAAVGLILALATLARAISPRATPNTTPRRGLTRR
jgi:hypothetical protein